MESSANKLISDRNYYRIFLAENRRDSVMKGWVREGLITRPRAGRNKSKWEWAWFAAPGDSTEMDCCQHYCGSISTCPLYEVPATHHAQKRISITIRSREYQSNQCWNKILFHTQRSDVWVPTIELYPFVSRSYTTRDAWHSISNSETKGLKVHN